MTTPFASAFALVYGNACAASRGFVEKTSRNPCTPAATTIATVRAIGYTEHVDSSWGSAGRASIGRRIVSFSGLYHLPRKYLGDRQGTNILLDYLKAVLDFRAARPLH